MQIEKIENGFATVTKTRTEEESINLTERAFIISPNDFCQAAAQINRLIAEGMPLENFCGLLFEDPTGTEHNLYLLINDGKEDLACIKVA